MVPFALPHTDRRSAAEFLSGLQAPPESLTGMTLVLTADGPTRNVHLVAVLLASFAVSGVVVLFGNAYLAVAAEVAALFGLLWVVRRALTGTIAVGCGTATVTTIFGLRTRTFAVSDVCAVELAEHAADSDEVNSVAYTPTVRLHGGAVLALRFLESATRADAEETVRQLGTALEPQRCPR